MGSLQLQDFAAGWVGGAASVVVGHPLDTIKTRLQAGQGYGNTLNCVLTVYRNESVAGFFKGMSFPLASIAVYSSVVFGVFSNTQRLLSQLRHGDPSCTPELADMALASTVAGFVSVAIGTPVDLVKIRLQMQTQPYIEANIKLKSTVPGFPVYRGPIHCFRTVLQKEGIAGIYRGAGAMLLRDVPGYCFYFIPYTFFCGWITPDGCISPNPSSIWLAGGVAGKHLFFRQHWKTRMGRFPGQITGWLRGHHLLLVTRKGHGAERPFSPMTKFPSTTTALYDLPNFMEVTLSDLHRAQCQQEGKHPVPSSPWMSHSSLRITLPAIRGSQDASRRGLQPVGCPPGGCAPYPCAAEAELTVTDHLLFFSPVYTCQ
ncbi:solute carrier family 25 member 48 isoform X1 [Haliaeetus albicilla]|uniref:solute carrier family 25 member 48 isoform X1 n=1 Tax=Haliaeetus albicilla TaxID=8969 RepID=UPI0037E862AA